MTRDDEAKARHDAAQKRLEYAENTDDRLMMMVAAAVSEGLRCHVEPDSPWRLNLIKEVADQINHDNAIALAAIEGTVLDLGQGYAAMRADLDQLRRGN